MFNLQECKQCGRIFEKEASEETTCECCKDPKKLEEMQKKLNKSEYVSRNKLTQADKKALAQRYGKYWTMADEKR